VTIFSIKNMTMITKTSQIATSCRIREVKAMIIFLTQAVAQIKIIYHTEVFISLDNLII